MPEPLSVLDAEFARILASCKADFLSLASGDELVHQHGGAALDSSDFPGWPEGLTTPEPVIETYVASTAGVVATSDNQPFVYAWTPLVSWIDDCVRSALKEFGADLAGDAYVTASLTATAELEGLAHMDDDTFIPEDPVGIVAIIGQWVGPRAPSPTVSLRPATPPRPMGQIVFDDATRAAFEAGDIEQTACEADQLVIFPQFGQLHAGPAATHVAHRGEFRQLLVYRAQAVPA